MPVVFGVKYENKSSWNEEIYLEEKASALRSTSTIKSVSEDACLRLSLAHSHLDIHHTYIPITGHSHILIKDAGSTWAADEWAAAGRKCEITWLLFFLAVFAKHYPRKHAQILRRTGCVPAFILTDDGFITSLHLVRLRYFYVSACYTQFVFSVLFWNSVVS